MTSSGLPNSIQVAALLTARQALHGLCRERGTTDGYRAAFDELNRAIESIPAAVTDEIVERAARAMYAEDPGAWDRLPENWRDLHRTRARAALAAAFSTEATDG